MKANGKYMRSLKKSVGKYFKLLPIRNMSIISEKGFLLTYVETEVTCPICEQPFDCAKKSENYKYPIFDTKCPKCKGKITISLPILGGDLKCYETHCPKSVKRLETTTAAKINSN